MYVKLVWVLDPHRCSPELSTGSCSLSAHTLRASRQVERYARVTVVKGCRSLVYLCTDAGTTVGGRQVQGFESGIRDVEK